MSTAIGERMKRNYEDRTRYQLPRRTYTVVRVDGRAFHSFCRGLERPFDESLHASMCAVGVALCENAQGARFGYVQSDECSVVLADFMSTDTDAWFDGGVQKIASISASIATVAFNRSWCSDDKDHWAQFDARVFTIPDYYEVENYLIWRQQDATRNSIAMAAQSEYSAKQLHRKNSSEMQEMLHERGVNWNDYSENFKRGSAIVRETYTVDGENGDRAERHRWVTVEKPPVFTQDRGFLRDRISVSVRSLAAGES